MRHRATLQPALFPHKWSSFWINRAWPVLLLAALVAAGGGTCGNTSTPTGPIIFSSGPNQNNPGTGGQNNSGTDDRPTVRSNDHVLGSASAPVTVIEYADFQCPCCGKFAREDFDTIRANYIDTGKVRWVYRHFPLSNIHPRATPAAQASECASMSADFYDFVELTFGTLNGAGAPILTDAQLRQHAASIGVDLTAYDLCVANSSTASRVTQDFNSGVSLNVNGTPSFFVDEEMFPPLGASFCPNAADLSVVIERHLND